MLKALVVADLHQPLGQRFRFAQLRKIRKQIDAHRLKNIRRIVVQAKLDRNRVDKILILIDQICPCLLVALQAERNHALVRRRLPRFEFRLRRRFHRAPALSVLRR